MNVVPPVVDAHVHIYPPDVIAKREAFCRRDGWFQDLFNKPESRLATAGDLIASMDEAGIGCAVVAGFPWRDEGLCREHNAHMAEAAQRYPGRLAWLAIVNPADPGAVLDAENAFGRGACGLGEINADAQGLGWDNLASFQRVAEVCRAHRRPMMLHASEPVGHGYPGKGTATPERLLSLITAIPDTPLVLAHWGGGLPFFELMPEVAEVCREVVYDTAASTYLYRFQVFRTVLDLVGPDRVLFGSDFPVLRQRRFLERVKATAWRDQAEADAVLGGNASRVYNLEQTGVAP